MTHVFLSYVREDSESVRALGNVLQEYDVEVWLDRDKLKPGYRWANAIQEAIRDGAFFVPCFSKAYLERTKTYMNEELTVAIDELRQRAVTRAWFIPVVLDDCEIPDRSIGAGETLRSLQWITLQYNWHTGVSRILAVIKPDSAKVYELIGARRNDSSRSRIKAADALGSLGPLAAQAVLPLERLLTDENSTVAAAASQALGKIGVADQDVVSSLLDVMRSGDYYSSKHAAFALAALGAPAMPALLEATGYPGYGVGHYAAEAFGSVSDPLAVPHLIYALRRGFYSAIRALGRIGSPARSAAADIAKVLSRDRRMHSSSDAAEALGDVYAEDSIPILAEVLLDLEANNLTRASAAKALGKLRNPNALPALEQAGADPDPNVQKEAVRAIAKLVK